MVQWHEILSEKVSELEYYARENNIHPLALEDCIHRDQRPKLEDYGNHQFLVWFMVAGGITYELQFVIFEFPPAWARAVSHLS
jgi:Mg2+ and Co2+ transporter CorA